MNYLCEHEIYTACGIFACNFLGCDECYPGHVLERHMFGDNSWYTKPGCYMFRVGLSYDPSTQRRAREAARLIYGAEAEARLNEDRMRVEGQRPSANRDGPSPAHKPAPRRPTRHVQTQKSKGGETT
jgi:hypothetical protein